MKTRNESYSRYMMYFKPEALRDIRIISRTLNIAMIDFVESALDAYAYKKKSELKNIPPRKNKKYTGPRNGTHEAKRIRYIMLLNKDVIDKTRDIASLENRRFSHVCDEALNDFIEFTKTLRNLKKTSSNPYAVRGRKSPESVETLNELLKAYQALISV